MPDLLNNEVLCILLTLICYRAGLEVQKRTKSALFNPILIAVILVLVFLWVTGADPEAYQRGNTRLSWLITPATVCLAIPMYEQLEILLKNKRAILAGIAAGAFSCMACVGLIAVTFGFSRELTVTMLPKSVTAAIGVPLATLAGGIPSITTAVILLTGILAAIFGPTLCKLFRLEDEISQGVAFGTAGHVVGTSRANEISPLVGAVGSLSLTVAGLLTALVFPLLVS